MDQSDRLVAHLSLRDLVLARPEEKLADIMDQELIYVTDDEEIENLNEIISKYNLVSIPVVDERMVLIGMVHINDVVHNLLKSRRRKR